MRLTSDNLAIEPIRESTRMKGSLYVPDTVLGPIIVWGRVLAVGPGHRGERSKALWPIVAKVGDTILYPKGADRLSYENVTIDGKRYDIVSFVQERDAGLLIRDGEVIPLYNRVVGQIVEEPKLATTESGLILFNSDKRVDEKSTSHVRVRIDFVGFGERNDLGNIIPLDIKSGDVVIADKWDCFEYEIDGNALSPHCILEQDKILAIDDEYVAPDMVDEERIFAQVAQAAARRAGYKPE